MSGKVKLSERNYMLIKLLAVDLKAPYNVVINVNHIMYFYKSDIKRYNGKDCTFLRLDDNRSFYVRETIDEIYTMIRKGKKNG